MATSASGRVRLMSWGNFVWVLRHRAWTPYHLKRYWRFVLFRLRHPRVEVDGFVFLGKRVELYARKGYGRIRIGRWVHLGDHTRLRCHEGTLRIGDKCVFGSDNTVNCYLDVEFGEATIVSDWVYVTDFDHRTERLDLPIKDQGIVKSPVRIGPGSWVGTKVTVLRGTEVGRGSVLAANAVVRGRWPDHSVLGGVPARLLRDRASATEAPGARAVRSR
jgi:acetyltransferase-like isoleucine patch superfamily enzyme